MGIAIQVILFISAICCGFLALLFAAAAGALVEESKNSFVADRKLNSSIFLALLCFGLSHALMLAI